jgi:hypothetical protein
VPTTDASRWRFLAIDRGKTSWARTLAGDQLWFDFAFDPSGATVEVRPRIGPNAETTTWTCALGTKAVPVDPPLLQRNEDRGRMVDGERRTLVLNGEWRERRLELHTVEKRFRLQTGFRLRQELPDFW